MQCPVLITPSAYEKIDRIVLLYDGKPYALHAIKMFSYLLGNMNDLTAEVFTVKDKKMADLHLPDNRLMKEFIKRHFPKAQYKILKGDAKQLIVEYLRSAPKVPIIIMSVSFSPVTS